jgi:hypothetical protein
MGYPGTLFSDKSMQGLRVGCSMVSVDHCRDSNWENHGQSKVKVHCKMTNACATIIYDHGIKFMIIHGYVSRERDV